MTRVGHGAGPTEAWTQVEIDYCDAAAAAALEADALAAVADVHLVVDDFPEMRDRMVALGEHDPILRLVGGRALRVPRRRGVRPRRPRRSSFATAPSSVSSAPSTRSIRLRSRPTHRTVRSSSRGARPCRRSTAVRGVTCVSVRDGDRGASLRRSAGVGRLPPERAVDPDGRRSGAGRARTRRRRRRDPHRAFDPKHARDVAARPRVRAGRGSVGAPRDRHRRAPGAPARAHLRRRRAGRRLVDGARVPPADTASRPGFPSSSPRRWPRRTVSPYRDLESLVGASTLARITLSVRRPDGSPPDLDDSPTWSTN